MRIWTTLAVLGALLAGGAIYASAGAYTCTTSCFGNTCTTTCF
jgi:hypothetical protein